MLTRRSFLKYTAGGTLLTLFGFDRLAGVSKAVAQIPGGSLDPSTIVKYQTPLLIPPVMPRAGMIVLRGGRNADYYEISMRQFQQQILPAGLPKTTVWGYGSKNAQNGPALFNAPSLTIEAKYKDLATTDPFDLGVVHGKLSALRWVLGEDWDFLDT